MNLICWQKCACSTLFFFWQDIKLSQGRNKKSLCEDVLLTQLQDIFNSGMTRIDSSENFHLLLYVIGFLNSMI